MLRRICAVLVLTVTLCQAVKVDMGQCSCNCGATFGSTVTSHFLGGTQDGKFYESMRGLKGETGRAGEVGQEGTKGAVGEVGLRGPPAEDSSKQQAGKRILPSCASLSFASDEAASGIYKIKPSGTTQEIQVFCEMAAAGGGWTLVASIHENNIYGKCTPGDKWSSEQGILHFNRTSTASSNWENFNTFGFPEGATSADYKSAAYFNLPSQDVMVWHVPNDSEMSEWSSRATLKYYTTNNFLSTYGGSLQALFAKYYHMKKVTSSEDSNQSIIEQITDTFEASTQTLRGMIPNFNSYNYDGGNLNIGDGGNDMYDTGNRVSFKIGEAPYQLLIYEKKYRDFLTGTQVYSRKTHPFIAYMWIQNTNEQTEAFSIKVVSGTGADNSGSHDSYASSLTVGNLTCKYHSYNVFNAGSDPSICEVYFYCFSEQLWSSVPASTFTRTQWSSSTDSLSNSMTINGSPQSVLLGYTLLSRTGSAKVLASQVEAVLRRMMIDFARVSPFPVLSCSRLNESLSVPVTFLQGNNETVLNDIPPNEKAGVEPGFLHFRALDPSGQPNAICPGVMSKTCNPAAVCIGGTGIPSNESFTHQRACGDFAGWQGKPGDNATWTTASGSARPLKDLESTILVFTR